MSTLSSPPSVMAPDTAPLTATEAMAVLQRVALGDSIEPQHLARVRARTAAVTAAIVRDRGVIDDATFQSLLDDEG